jgi:hypothetical protein
MPLFIDVIARENTNLIRNALTTPPTNAEVVGAFRYVERGVMGDPPQPRTDVTGKWIGVIAINRAQDDSIESAQMTWQVTDAQMAALGLTDQSKINAFAQKLVDDVRTSLVQRAARNRGGQIVGFWEVSSVLRTVPRVGVGPEPTPGTTPRPTPGQTSNQRQDNPQETSYWPLVGGIALVGAAVYFLGKK